MSRIVRTLPEESDAWKATVVRSSGKEIARPMDLLLPLEFADDSYSGRGRCGEQEKEKENPSNY